MTIALLFIGLVVAAATAAHDVGIARKSLIVISLAESGVFETGMGAALMLLKCLSMCGLPGGNGIAKPPLVAVLVLVLAVL